MEWVHHGELLSVQSTSIPHIASHSGTNVDASFVGNVNATRLLNDIFGIYNQGNVKNNDANIWDVGDPMFGVDDEFLNEVICNGAMNEGENNEDVRYRRLLEQAE